MKLKTTTLAIALLLAMIGSFFYGLAKYSQSMANDDQSFKTHLPTTPEAKQAKIDFAAPQPGIPFPRIELDSKTGIKALDDRVWNYVMNDHEFRKYFGLSKVKCSEMECALTVSLERATWQDLQSYVKARPDFASASIVIVGGRTSFEVHTRKFR